VEINALLRGVPTNHTRRRSEAVAPVRALDPLVEIGLEHMMLATQPDEHAALVARAVTGVDVMRAARLARPVLALSQFLLDNADRYRATCQADPTDAAARDDWLQFFFEGIAQRAYVAVEQLGRMHRLRDRYRDAAPDTPAARLVDLLLSHPVVDTPLIGRRLAVPPERAERIRAAAQDAGWLQPYPGAPQVWTAPEVLDIFVGRGPAEAPTRGSRNAPSATGAETLTEAHRPAG
jgi:hypothetical protein